MNKKARHSVKTFKSRLSLYELALVKRSCQKFIVIFGSTSMAGREGLRPILFGNGQNVMVLVQVDAVVGRVFVAVAARPVLVHERICHTPSVDGHTHCNRTDPRTLFSSCSACRSSASA